MTKRLEVLTGPWFGAWDELLNSQVVVRSSITFNQGTSVFHTELLLVGEDNEICRVICSRSLGSNIYPPVTKLETPNVLLEVFLTTLVDQWNFTKKTSRLAELCLEPVPHVAIISQYYATNEHLLPSSHPLLMIYYGMVCDGIATQQKHSVRTIWPVLLRRFKAFLYQQEATLVKNTIGQLLSPHADNM